MQDKIRIVNRSTNEVVREITADVKNKTVRRMTRYGEVTIEGKTAVCVYDARENVWIVLGGLFNGQS